MLLTFDDGPHPRYTDRVLEILAKYKIQGVFFQVGQNLGSIGQSGEIKLTPAAQASYRILESGSSLGNHSNYIRLFFGSNKPLLLRSLNYVQSRLDSRLFFRANRKQIINLNFIESIHTWPNGGYLVKLRGGFEVTMSRRQAQQFQETTKL